MDEHFISSFLKVLHLIMQNPANHTVIVTRGSLDIMMVLSTKYELKDIETLIHTYHTYIPYIHSNPGVAGYNDGLEHKI